jgi:hypothetical protein
MERKVEYMDKSNVNGLIYVKPGEGGSFPLLSNAELAHHMKYLGRTGGFKNPDGTSRVPTPKEVVELGWEPTSYLDQFDSTGS